MESKATIGRVLLQLNDIAKDTEAILHSVIITDMFQLLARAIRIENMRRCDHLEATTNATNGTELSHGASDSDEYKQAHAARRLADGRAINQRR